MMLHPQLQHDCILLGQLPLCAVLWMPDANYPWLILVPQRDNIREIYELSPEDQQQLTQESSFVAKQLASSFHADKMNIAALGNMVPQLHIHHVVRYRDDAAWPAPVWGAKPLKPYSDAAWQAMRSKLDAAIFPTEEPTQ